MPKLKINGVVIEGATEFGYDGCHKIYLSRSPEERSELIECGYVHTIMLDQDGGFLLPIGELPRVWSKTCGLRFIRSADLTTVFVPQGKDADVTYE